MNSGWSTSNELSREKWSSISFLTLSRIEFEAEYPLYLELWPGKAWKLGKTLISCLILRKMHKSDNQIKLHRGIFCRWENKIKTSKVRSIVIFQLCDWIFIILLKVSNGLKILHKKQQREPIPKYTKSKTGVFKDFCLTNLKEQTQS